MNKDPRIVISGWGHTRFGRQEHSLEELVVEAGRTAIENAGIEARDIDEIVFGNFNAGMHPLGFPSSLALQIDDGLWGKPSTRVENACSSGAAAMQTGIRSVLSGQSERVLVIGAEKMTGADPATVGQALLAADYDAAGEESSVGFAGLFADVAKAYGERIADPMDAMAHIAVKNHRNGSRNPLAHLQRELSYSACSEVSEKNPLVADPLRRTDCSPVSDGAAAVVISGPAAASAQSAHGSVNVLGWGHANDYPAGHRRDPLAFAGSGLAWERALSMADLGTEELSFVELHDCFTIAELILYDVLGLTPEGMTAAAAVSEGHFNRDGCLPVNISGGLKAKGHPVGATGVSQIVMSAMQLSGSAGELQLDGPRVAAVHNMGGLAIANYVHVLAAAE